MKQKLTRRFIETLTPQAKRYDVTDTQVPGFLVRVMPTGAMSFIVRYRIKGHHNPVTHRLGPVSVLTPEEAREQAREAIAKAIRGEDPRVRRDENTDTVVDVLSRYADGLKGKHQYNQRCFIRLHIEPVIKKLRVTSLTAEHVEKISNNLIAKGKRRTAAACVILFRSALRKANLDPAPAMTVKASVWRKRSRIAEPDELRAVLAAANQMLTSTDCWPWAVYLPILCVMTGARPSEWRTAQWSDIEGNELIRQEHKTLHKTGEPRVIPLSDATVSLLSEIPRLEGNPYILCGKNHGTYLVNYYRTWRKICEQAGVEGLRPQDLRRTFASLALQAGFTGAQISKALGHSDLDTVDGYAWISRAQKHRLSATVSALLDSSHASQQTHLASLGDT